MLLEALGQIGTPEAHKFLKNALDEEKNKRGFIDLISKNHFVIFSGNIIF